MASTLPILILNGPNLNVLGRREPEIYGSETLADIEASSRARAAALGLEIDFRQSNHEGECVGWAQEARDGHSGIIVNAGALTHSSLALQDALRYAEKPVVEVHLSNIFRREPMRHRSLIAPVAAGVICGFGGLVYELALEAIAPLVGAAAKSRK